MKKNDPARESGAARDSRESKTYRRNSSTPPAAGQAPASSQSAMPRRQAQTLRLLQKRGRRGLTKLEAPPALSLGLASHVHYLRRRGFQITTLREMRADSWIGRYFLLGAP